VEGERCNFARAAVASCRRQNSVKGRTERGSVADGVAIARDKRRTVGRTSPNKRTALALGASSGANGFQNWIWRFGRITVECSIVMNSCYHPAARISLLPHCALLRAIIKYKKSRILSPVADEGTGKAITHLRAFEGHVPLRANAQQRFFLCPRCFQLSRSISHRARRPPRISSV
jgi:hypothetical protein